MFGCCPGGVCVAGFAATIWPVDGWQGGWTRVSAGKSLKMALWNYRRINWCQVSCSKLYQFLSMVSQVLIIYFTWWYVILLNVQDQMCSILKTCRKCESNVRVLTYFSRLEKLGVEYLYTFKKGMNVFGTLYLPNVLSKARYISYRYISLRSRRLGHLAQRWRRIDCGYQGSNPEPFSWESISLCILRPILGLFIL